MDTYFAPAPRTDRRKFVNQIATVSHSPIMDALLKTVSGLLIILNEDRQIVAMNHLFLNQLGIDDPEETLGLRLGESLHCVHAHEKPNGCGTTKSCVSCGAALAIMDAIDDDKISEKICVLTSNKYGTVGALSLLIKAQPIEVEQERFILVSAQDITQQELWANLERVFFHDINNALNGLLGYSQLLSLDFPDNQHAQMIKMSAERLYKEISLQRVMSTQKTSKYILTKSNYSIEKIRTELTIITNNHKAAKGKIIKEIWPEDDMIITTDMLLLTRILSNMVLNALEETQAEGEISLTTTVNDTHISWSVWNGSVISEQNKLKIFQKHFSTKAQTGRGFGTYSMKLFGEDYLKGEVGFTSTATEGTTFSLTLPLD